MFVAQLLPPFNLTGEKPPYRAVDRSQSRAVDLTAQNSQLMPQEEQFGLGVVDPKSNVGDIQQQAQARIQEREEHRG